jgi:hypothetical protein
MIPVAVWLGARAQGLRGTAALRRALPRALLALAVAFVIGGWWWALNLLRYGTLQPEATSLPTWPLPTLSFWEFVWAFIDRVGNSFFGNFALLELPLARPLTWTLSALFAVLVVVALTRRAQWGVLLLLAALPALTIVMLFTTTYQLHLQSHVLPGLQGRYLFTVLVPIAVFVALGLERLGAALHAPRVVFLEAAVGGLVLALFGAWHAFRGYYWEPGWALMAAVSRWLSWTPYSWKVIALFAVLAALAAAGVLLGLLRRTAAPAERSLTPA